MRAVVRDFIERLRPASTVPSPLDRRWRAYLTLTEHYLEGKPLAEIARELSVQPVSCRRALQQALDALGTQLQEAEARAITSVAASTTSNSGQANWPINTAPVVSGPFIGRQRLLEQAESLLASGCRRLALYGLPGSGKSTALARVVRSPFAQAQFADGVLWAYLGAQPDLATILGDWGLALGLSQHDLGRLNTAQRAQTLRHLLDARHMLFAFNDVWQCEHIAPLLIGNEHCAYVLATSNAEVALVFADAHATLRVEELTLEESLQVLNALAPGLEADWREAMEEIAQACGGLPLALSLIGHYLRRESHAGQPRRIQAAFARLRERRARLSLQPALSEPSGLAPGARSLGETIALSVSLLSARERRGLASLCIFLPKPVTFDEEAALAVLRATVGDQAELKVLDRLVDASLIECRGTAYSIHPVIVDWHVAATSPRTEVIRDAARKAFLEHAVQRLRSPELCPLPPAEWNVALTAVQAAIEARAPQAAAHFAILLFDCLDRRGLRPLAERLLEIAEAGLPNDDSAQRHHLGILRGRVLLWHGELRAAIRHLDQVVADIRERATHLLPTALLALAHAHLQAGDARQALDACDQALALDEINRSPDQRLAALATRVSALGHLACYDEAEAAIQQTLSLARDLQRPVTETIVLIYMGALCWQRGRRAEAVRYLQAGLDLARRIDFRDRVLYASTALGIIAAEGGDDETAERYYRDALPLARQLNSLPNIVLLEYALGLLETQRQRFESARQHLSEALGLAEQHGFAWFSASAHVALGEYHLAQNALTDAEDAFTRGLELADQRGYADVAALGRFGLARVRAAHGDTIGACDLAESSLKELRARAHYRADEVAHWIDALPPTTPAQLEGLG
ncbi:MAG: NB-ARC domain-containing protein [Methylacidiphilales bacterium]|nr:NB-ARC domain-containing protein [Candidatus Methylacidiphilales bacterium]